MNEIQKYFYQAIQERRQSLRSLTESFHQALEIAGLNKLKEMHSQTLVEIIESALVLVEEDGLRKEVLGQEPVYHNRQHFADACLALGYFLKEVTNLSEHQKLLLMLTMLVHDFGHKGIANLKPNFCQEKETIQLLHSSAVACLNQNDFELLTDLILGTTPQNLESTNALYINDPKNIRYFMQSLINDADIAASFIDSLTPSLTKAILIESGNLNPSDQEVTAGITFFKKNFHITTDIAKKFLF